MPGNKLLKFLFVVGGLAAGAFFVAQKQKAKMDGRVPASAAKVQKMQKALKNKQISNSQIDDIINSTGHGNRFKKKEKPNKPIMVRLQFSDGEIEAGVPFSLKGIVRSRVNLDNTSYQWVLDPDIELVSGSQTGTLHQFAMGEEKDVEVVLKAKKKKGLKVWLKVYSDRSGVRIGGSGYYNTKAHMRDLASARGLKKKKKIPVSRIIY